MASVNPPTRAELRQDVLNIADAYQSPRWDATQGGEVDRRLGIVHMREWKRILNANAYYQTQKYVVTTDANGNIPLTALSTVNGDSTQTLYRILVVAFNNIKYEEVLPKNYYLSTLAGLQDFVWFRDGANIVVPNSPTTTASGIWVNWVPQRFDQLAGDTSIVSLPPDYDDVFSYEGAAALLTKGAAETDAAGELRAYADSLRQDLLQDIARVGIEPLRVTYDDSPRDWGSQ